MSSVGRHAKEITHQADIDRHLCQGGIDTSASRTLASVSSWRSRFLREGFLPLRRFEVLLCSSCPRVHIPENKKARYSRHSPLSREAFVPNSDSWKKKKKKKKRRIEMNIGESNFFQCWRSKIHWIKWIKRTSRRILFSMDFSLFYWLQNAFNRKRN